MRFLTTTLALVAALAPLAPAQARPTPSLTYQYVSPFVDMVTVLPGERFPLRVTDATGQNVPVRWSADSGTVAHASNAMAVWKAPLGAGVAHLKGVAEVGGQTITRTLTMVVTVPATKLRGGKLNGYPIGTYPKGHQAEDTPIANRGVRDHEKAPAGFIELTPARLGEKVSRHYTMGDFAGKDGWVGGKKYLFINPRLVEKLERAISRLEAKGYQAGKLELMSAYRSPWLNAEIGNATSLSRHTYGDAADVLTKDFNRDGRLDARDALILKATFDSLDRETDLTGGLSLYQPNGAHGYFVHTDARGFAARW